MVIQLGYTTLWVQFSLLNGLFLQMLYRYELFGLSTYQNPVKIFLLYFVTVCGEYFWQCSWFSNNTSISPVISCLPFAYLIVHAFLYTQGTTIQMYEDLWKCSARLLRKKPIYLLISRLRENNFCSHNIVWNY